MKNQFNKVSFLILFWCFSAEAALPDAGIFSVQGDPTRCAVELKFNADLSRGFLIYAHNPSGYFCEFAGKTIWALTCYREKSLCEGKNPEGFKFELESLDSNSFSAGWSGYAPEIYSRSHSGMTTPRFFAKKYSYQWYMGADLCDLGDGRIKKCSEINYSDIESSGICSRALEDAIRIAMNQCRQMSHKKCLVTDQSTEIFTAQPYESFSSGCRASVLVEGK